MFITYHADLGNTPARVNRFTGEIQVNQRYWSSLPDFRKKFIIEHEKGHFSLPSRNELVADKYAFKNLAGTQPRSLKESVYSISRVLTFRNPEHMHRLVEMVKMALQYDWENNKNQEALTGLKELNQLLQTNQNQNYMYAITSSNQESGNSYHKPKFGYDSYEDEDSYDNGAGKERRQARRAKRQEQKEKKRDLKNDRLAAKNEIKLARADAKRTKADAKMSLAEQGKSGTDWIGSAVSGVAGLFGKKSEGGEQVDAGGTGAAAGPSGNPVPEKKLLGMPMGIGIAVIVVVVLVIGGIGFFALKGKKAVA
jgi:hypothetical protein